MFSFQDDYREKFEDLSIKHEAVLNRVDQLVQAVEGLKALVINLKKQNKKLKKQNEDSSQLDDGYLEKIKTLKKKELYYLKCLI